MPDTDAPLVSVTVPAMTMKGITTRVLVTLAALAALLLATPGAASAGPAPKLGVLGDDIWVVGNNAFCHGAIHVDIDTEPTKPAQATAWLTSRGFNGVQPEWSRNPSCTINVAIGWWFGPQYREKVVPLTVGPRPGAPVRVDLRGVGQGLQLMSFTTHPDLNKGVSYYVIIP